MLHHMLPDAVARGSLEPNLDYYEPRTAHGSSLSPGIHAGLFARAGRLPAAVAALETTSRIDLDDLTATTGAGLHLAAMGSLWQALTFGFLGLRPVGTSLRVDPHVPAAWPVLEARVTFRGNAVRVRAEREATADRLILRAERPLRVVVGESQVVDVSEAGISLARIDGHWERA
jgi:trehalose/maltose hydrolase-like predicted phosphorylase